MTEDAFTSEEDRVTRHSFSKPTSSGILGQNLQDVVEYRMQARQNYRSALISRLASSF